MVLRPKLRRWNAVAAWLVKDTTLSALETMRERPVKIIELEPPSVTDPAVFKAGALIAFANTMGFEVVPATAGHVIADDPLVPPKPVITQVVVLSTPQPIEVNEGVSDVPIVSE